MELQTTDSALIGVAGSGKTSSLTMVLNKAPPVNRVSTPCAKKPVRVRIGVKDEDDISMVKDEEYLTSVAHTAKEVATSLPTPSAELIADSSLTPPAPPIRKYTTHEDYVLKLEEEMMRHLGEETSHNSLLNTLRWNNMTDTGGQPQFLQMLPIFVHHISLAIFTIKLNERLDHHPDIEYYNKEGKPVGKPFKSHDTHEQIIRRCMRALASQARGAKKFKFLFIGTHKDLIEECSGESIQDKNRQLLKIVNSFKLKDHVVYSNQGCTSIIFAINTKTPRPEDWEVMKQVRRIIVDSSDIDPIRIPLRWFALELALLRFVKETKQAVLTESDCLKHVAHLHFTDDDFKAALKYLHQAKLIIYFEKRGLVVADMELILNKLGEIVSYNIELVTEGSLPAALTSIWKKFCQHGILSIKCLNRFPSHFKEGLFTAGDLLELFADLRIVSQLHSSEEFLMPCLLPVEEEACCCPDLKTPAMAIEIPNGGPLLGTYCRLICHLMNEEKWSLAVNEEGEPRQLTRNSIQFSAPKGYPGVVTIHDPLSSFFVITYTGCTEVCSLICKTILKGISIAENYHCFDVTAAPENTEASSDTGASSTGSSSSTNINAKQGQPKVTFVCLCGTTSHLHSAKMSDDRKYLRCPFSSHYQTVTANHQTWFKGESLLQTVCSSSR